MDEQEVTRILLVEDNGADEFIVVQALRAALGEVHIDVMRDAPKALHKLDEIEADPSQTSPDLFVIDLNLPGGWGGDVLARIRRSSCCKGAPVIITSSSRNPADTEMAASLDAAYFWKPLGLEAYMQIGTLAQTLLLRQRLRRPHERRSIGTS